MTTATATLLCHSHSTFVNGSPSRNLLPEQLRIQEQYQTKMAVRLRLARLGRKHRPFYRIIAANSTSARDGNHLEVLGYYNPLPGKDGDKRMGLNFDRVKYWLSVGAKPSEPVQRILFRAELLPPPSMVAMGGKFVTAGVTSTADVAKEGKE
ncbi:hypothetical protein Syun_023843 [Stephania yunnanensis]|uniref:30S ribosomal protein S16, chloroplastic n=1 Tax=Stephania yunnanensis TaxID=152371 RepID=A0AAP0I2I7_9MAGN